jgi:hypothetical protein
MVRPVKEEVPGAEHEVPAVQVLQVSPQLPAYVLRTLA